MHLGTGALEGFFDRHREEDALVLATVTGIQGSSYRKPGAMMLISAGGGYAGMISGGCLEDDLALRAANVFADGKPSLVSYDNQADEQLIWNLGLGCEGVIHLLLQRLERSEDFGFLPLLFDSLSRRRECVLALVTRSEDSALPLGSHAVITVDGDCCGEAGLFGLLEEQAFPWSSRNRHRDISLGAPPEAANILLVDVPPVPRILICGAGPDALPLTRMIAELGWEIYLVDHRGAHALAEKFPSASKVLKLRPETLSQTVDLAEVAAAVVMSHHLERDTAYLGEILKSEVPYVGLLGPSARRRQIQERLGCAPGRIHGPVGLDIGAELPESIALATLAEIHAALNGRSGGMLSPTVAR